MEKRTCTSQITGSLPTGITNYFQLYNWIIENSVGENIAEANDIQIEWQEGPTKFLFKEQMVTIKAKAFDYVVSHLPSRKETHNIMSLVCRAGSQILYTPDDKTVDALLDRLLKISLPKKLKCTGLH